MQNKYVLKITPQTHVRATQGDRVLFKIGKDRLRPAGLKRLLRLERYNKYKIDLCALAKEQHFRLPEQGGHICFYIPVSKSWRKHKKVSMHMMLHQEKPDIDNLGKSFIDSILAEDKHIADLRLTKRWVNQENGWIEITWDTAQFRSRDVLL